MHYAVNPACGHIVLNLCSVHSFNYGKNIFQSIGDIVHKFDTCVWLSILSYKYESTHWERAKVIITLNILKTATKKIYILRICYLKPVPRVLNLPL